MLVLDRDKSSYILEATRMVTALAKELYGDRAEAYKAFKRTELEFNKQWSEFPELREYTVEYMLWKHYGVLK